MRKFILFFMIFVPILQPQADSIRFSCFTPTTILQIWSEGNYLISQLRHPYGAHFTPFYKGSVSVFQISELTLKAKRQREFSDFQEVQWSLEDCMIQPPYMVSCHSGKIIHPSNDKLKALSLETSLVTTQMVSGIYHGLNFSLGLRNDGNYDTMTSDFSVALHCSR